MADEYKKSEVKDLDVKKELPKKEALLKVELPPEPELVVDEAPLLKTEGVFKLTPSTNPATLVSDVVSVITNISDSRLSFGFIPPHGKEIASGASLTIVGDLRAQLLTGGGRQHKRKVAAFDAAISDGLIRYYVNHRHILYCKVNDSLAIAAGDLVFYNSGDASVKPASSFTWDTNLATTQAGFANVFLGVALDAHSGSAGAVTNFRVDISPLSIYKYTTSSEAHVVGAIVGPAKDTGNALVNQTLANAVAASAIGRVAIVDSASVTSTLVRFQSAYWGHNTAGAM